MAKQKFYAVRKGRSVGIFVTWDECQKQTSGFPGAQFKSFASRVEAEGYLRGEEDAVAAKQETLWNVPMKKKQKIRKEYQKGEPLAPIYAFTDGSHNVIDDVHVYGFGGILHYSDSEEDIILQGCGDDPELGKSYQIAGEVLGVIAAMEKAIALGIAEMTVYYDYIGVEDWTDGTFQAKAAVSQMYLSRFRELSKDVQVEFVHAKAHSGIPGNELADKLAKESVGLGE